MAIDDFDEYLKQSEPQKREKGYAWQTAIGLQAVDGLKPSDYLLETARRDIEGEITTAIFTILYLRSMGFNVENDLFAKHSWYFRNALVRANYQNVQKGIMRNPEFLIRFFRNLLLGEENELKNRYMVVNAPDVLKAEEESHPTTTQQVPNNFSTTTQQVFELIVAVGSKNMSVKEMMTSVGLKDRVNFLRNYLNPAIQENVLRLLYPDKPNHPRQKYLLTVKGLAILNNINKY